MKKLLCCLLIICLLFLVGCSSTPVEDVQTVEDTTQEIAEPELPDVEPEPADVPELVCPETCSDDNECTEDLCSEETSFECVHNEITPCCGDGVCDDNETCEDDCKTEEIRLSAELRALYGDIHYSTDTTLFKTIIFTVVNEGQLPVEIDTVNLIVTGKETPKSPLVELYRETLPFERHIDGNDRKIFERHISEMDLGSHRHSSNKESNEITLQLISDGEIISESVKEITWGTGLMFYDEYVNEQNDPYVHYGRSVFTHPREFMNLETIDKYGVSLIKDKRLVVEEEDIPGGKEYINLVPLQIEVGPSFTNLAECDLIVDLFIYHRNGIHYYSYDLADLGYSSNECDLNSMMLELPTHFRTPAYEGGTKNFMAIYSELSYADGLGLISSAYTNFETPGFIKNYEVLN
jgi:hypothetical protein